MTKETRRNLMGMVVYFCIAVLFGGGFGLLALIVKEDNDRCYYYGGRYEWGDVVRGCGAVALGVIVRGILTMP